MEPQAIRFDDGAAYERGMGVWSQIAGAVFLDWLDCPSGLRWIDVGCGNGAFTELVVQRCAPEDVQGIDPSAGQITFAQTRSGTQTAQFQVGDAMALPFDSDQFDAAVMALVIFFVPDPAKGVAEMMRVVRPGGLISAYVWDMTGGGFPVEPIRRELLTLGITPVLPPSTDASRMDVLRGLWINGGLEGVGTREITIERTFTDFQDFWDCSTSIGSTQASLAQLSDGDLAELKVRVRDGLSTAASGRITCHARANAIRGHVPTAR